MFDFNLNPTLGTVQRRRKTPVGGGPLENSKPFTYLVGTLSKETRWWNSTETNTTLR